MNNLVKDGSKTSENSKVGAKMSQKNSFKQWSPQATGTTTYGRPRLEYEHPTRESGGSKGTRSSEPLQSMQDRAKNECGQPPVPGSPVDTINNTGKQSVGK